MNKHEAELVISLHNVILKLLNFQNVFLYFKLDIIQIEIGEAICNEIYSAWQNLKKNKFCAREFQISIFLGARC